MKRTRSLRSKSTRRSRRTKRSRRSVGSQMRPASTLRDELSMGTAPSVRTYVGHAVERNGMTTQRAVSAAPRRNYKITKNDINALLCPKYKFRYDGFGYNQALTKCTGLAVDVTSYDAATGVTSASRNTLSLPKGWWKGCEWAPGNQYWFESAALPIYKKIPDGSRRSVTELIEKYADVQSGNASAFNAGLDVDSYYKAIETYFSGAGTEGSGFVVNQSAYAFNICYHGGNQTHKFYNMGVTDVHMEFWELHPRHYMAGYVNQGYTSAAQTPANSPIYRHEWIWHDLVKDHLENSPFTNNKQPFDDNRAYDEIHDIGVRIDNDCRRILFKYKVGKSRRVKIPPGGTFTYVMNIPAFKVSGGEFLEYLLKFKEMDLFATSDNEREVARPAWIPKFTRILCGRMYGQTGYGLGTEGREDGNSADTSFIDKLGFGGGRVGHTMSEYHEMNLMPYMKRSTYSRVNYLDTSGITRFVDGGDDEILNIPEDTADDLQNTNTNNTSHPSS